MVKDIDFSSLKKKGGKDQPEKKTSALNSLLEKEITLFPFRFTDKLKESFYLELSTLLSAGLDMRAALELMEEEQINAKQTAVIRNIKNDLIAGVALWEALKQTGHFTPYEYFSVQIGEETGKMVLVLGQLQRYYASKLKQKKQLISALSYPVIILLTSVGAVGFMLVFIVPMFSDIFKRFGGDLPYLTRVILSVSAAIKANAWIVMVLFVAVGLYAYRNRKKIWMRKLMSETLKRTPVIGKIVYSLQLARFCNSMAVLIGSKVPIIRALSLIEQMIGFYPVQVTLKSISDDILHGVPLHQGMAKFDVYQRKMISLIKVGEEVNKLDVFFEKLSQQYSNEADHQTTLLNTFLEPAMIIFLGAVVGFILLAMYLPMFQMSTNIGH